MATTTPDIRSKPGRWRPLFAGVATLAIVFAAATSSAYAQAGMAWEDDRPRADFATAGVTTTPADEGDLQFETSLINRVGDGYIFEAPILARWGFLPDWEARLSVVLVSAVEGAEADWGQYIGFGAKWRFLQEDNFSLAFVPEFQIPVGGDDLSLLVPLIVALDFAFTDWIGLSVDGGVILSDDIGGRITVGVGAEVVQDLMLSLEFAAVSNEVRINEYETAINLWGTYWIDERWMANAGILKSLTEDDEWTFVLGISGSFGVGAPEW